MNYIKKYLKDEQQPNYDGFEVIVAGLSKTGTMSMKTALGKLLNGICYHGGSVFTRPMDEVEFWNRALDAYEGKGPEIEAREWREKLQGRGVRAGADLLIAMFYKELMAAFPDAKVVLTVRDAYSWFASAADLVRRMDRLKNDAHVKMFMWLMGASRRNETAVRVVNVRLNATGKSLTQMVHEGKESAIKFYLDWCREVDNTVPKEKLLMFGVQQGWRPLCDFLGKPVPKEDFPRKNDKASLDKQAQKIQLVMYLILYGCPLLLSLLLYLCISSYVSY